MEATAEREQPGPLERGLWFLLLATGIVLSVLGVLDLLVENADAPGRKRFLPDALFELPEEAVRVAAGRFVLLRGQGLQAPAQGQTRAAGLGPGADEVSHALT